jgi:hypothetical protein
MKVLVTAYNRDKKIQAIKGVRLVARQNDLKACKEFVEGTLPAELQIRSGLSAQDAIHNLAVYEVVAHTAGPDAILMSYLATLPHDMTVGHLRAALSGLGSFEFLSA